MCSAPTGKRCPNSCTALALRLVKGHGTNGNRCFAEANSGQFEVLVTQCCCFPHQWEHPAKPVEVQAKAYTCPCTGAVTCSLP